MKIRTITTGQKLSYPIKKSEISQIAEFNQEAGKTFENNDIEVQSIRMATQSWCEYLNRLTENEKIKEIANLEEICTDAGIDFLSIGTVNDLESIPIIAEIIAKNVITSTSVTIADIEKGISYDAISKAAETIIEISKTTDRGYGNFRFAAIANCPPHIPFFPAGYHNGDSCFAIGLECSDLICKAFSRSDDLPDVLDNLYSILYGEFKKVERIGERIEKKGGITFKGIDISTAPSLAEKESLVYAFEKLNLGKFGTPGTLAIAGMITSVLAAIEVKKCGYSGLMLPILEDYGLAQRWSEGVFNVDDVLAYSAISGTGLDCVPLPGDISTKKIRSILLDVAWLALRLNKPLSARLLPVPGKKAGEVTNFNSPYLVDCIIAEIK